MADTKKPVLADHQRKNKRLIPPLLAAMGDKHSPYSWARQLVPELLWIAMLQQGMGLMRGTDFAVQIALEADKVCQKEPKPIFSKMTSFRCLSEQQKNILIKNISALPYYNDAMAALSPMFIMIPESPFEFLDNKESVAADPVDNDVIFQLLPKLYDRHKREAVLTIAAGIAIGFRQGKILVAGEKAPQLAKMLAEDFKSVEDYPNSEASRAAGASLRAMAPMFLISAEDSVAAEEDEWLDKFWNQVGAFGDCGRPVQIQYDDEPKDVFWKIITRFRNDARKELYDRLSLWKFDLNAIEQFEVVGALLARQVTLAADLAASPPIWTSHSAPIFLRAMADVYIVLAWIFESPQERAIKFIEDGLGAVKLEIAHRKAELEKSGGKDEQVKKMVDYWESWLGSQRMAELVEVNLGNWNGITTRKMAEEAGCLDFYNYVYQPFSGAVHSSWPHVSDKNLLYCTNPAHRLHRLAVSVDLEPDPHWVLMAGKYLEKAYQLFDLKTGTKTLLPSAYARLLEGLEAATTISQPEQEEET